MNYAFVSWGRCLTLLVDDTGLTPADSARYTGFHYVDWVFDGADILYAVRTGYRGAKERSAQKTASKLEKKGWTASEEKHPVTKALSTLTEDDLKEISEVKTIEGRNVEWIR